MATHVSIPDSHQGITHAFLIPRRDGSTVACGMHRAKTYVYDMTASGALFTAKDPILFNGGDTDLYGYCVNDPVNLVDPDGKFAFLPVMMWIGLGSSIMGGIEYAHSFYYDQRIYNTLESQRKYLEKQRSKLIEPCLSDPKYEKYLEYEQFYTEAINKIVIQQAQIEHGGGVGFLKNVCDLVTGMASPK